MQVDKKGLEAAARAMCDGNWNARDFCETPNGEEPEDHREYWREKARAAILAYESARSAEPVASEIGEEAIARVVRQAMHSNPEEGPFRHRESERSLIASEAARQILALLQPTLDQAKAQAAALAQASEALKPFADTADSYEPDEGDGACVAWMHDFTRASVRRARDVRREIVALDAGFESASIESPESL